jgi:hypothetical protein
MQSQQLFPPPQDDSKSISLAKRIKVEGLDKEYKSLEGSMEKVKVILDQTQKKCADLPCEKTCLELKKIYGDLLAFHSNVNIFYKSLLKKDDFDDELLRWALIACSDRLNLLMCITDRGDYVGQLLIYDQNHDKHLCITGISSSVLAVKLIIPPFLTLCGALNGAVTSKKAQLLTPEPIQLNQAPSKSCCAIL